MFSKEASQALEDILDNILLASSFVKNMTYQAFLEDKRTVCMQSLGLLKSFQRQRVVCQKRSIIGTPIFLGQVLKDPAIFIAMIMKMFWKVEFGQQ